MEFKDVMDKLSKVDKGKCGIHIIYRKYLPLTEFAKMKGVNKNDYYCIIFMNCRILENPIEGEPVYKGLAPSNKPEEKNIVFYSKIGGPIIKFYKARHDYNGEVTYFVKDKKTNITKIQNLVNEKILKPEALEPTAGNEVFFMIYPVNIEDMQITLDRKNISEDIDGWLHNGASVIYDDTENKKWVRGKVLNVWNDKKLAKVKLNDGRIVTKPFSSFTDEWKDYARNIGVNLTDESLEEDFVCNMGPKTNEENYNQHCNICGQTQGWLTATQNGCFCSKCCEKLKSCGISIDCDFGGPENASNDCVDRVVDYNGVPCNVFTCDLDDSCDLDTYNPAETFDDNQLSCLICDYDDDDLGLTDNCCDINAYNDDPGEYFIRKYLN